MTIQEMYSLFDLIIDKTGSPYFTSNQKDLFFQRAEVTYVNGFFNPTGTSKHNAEATSVDEELIGNLMSEVFTKNFSTGKLPFATIEANLPGSGSLMYILGVSRNSNDDSCEADTEANYRKSRWVRHNDFSAHSENSFKSGTNKYPIHRYFDTYLKFSPKAISDIYISLVRQPIKVTLDDPTDSGSPGAGVVNSELPDKAHNEIVYLALQAAGIAIRETDFYKVVSAEEKDNV